VLYKLTSFLCVFILSAFALSAEPEEYEQLLKSADDPSFQMKEPSISAEMLQKILKLQKRVESIQSQALQNPESFTVNTKDNAPDKELQSDESIWLMISSSMPENTIRNYLADIDRYQLPIKVVIRGLVQSGMKKTLRWTQHHMKKGNCRDLKKCKWHKASIAIDPLPYRYFKVKSVPALAIGKTLRIASEETATQAEIESVIYGDASIMALLEKASGSSQVAETAFNQMRGKYPKTE
jgi:type-F conjugative transfer system pilin assembly protein TrbC